MALVKVEYAQIRDKIRAGDIIAFSGKSNFSELIKWATRSVVSHVGIILQSEVKGVSALGTDGYFNQIIESATLNGFSGVSISRLSDRVKTCAGEMWVLPLGAEARKKVDANLEAFYRWCLDQDHKPYDLPQALKAGLDALDKAIGAASTTVNREDFSKFFCSELAAGALEQATAVPSLNASEVTPIDLCSFSIFQEEYYQIAGETKEIRGFNSIDVRQWAQAAGGYQVAA